MPAGLQLGCMLLFPYRYWLSMIMSSVFVNWVITINYGNQANMDIIYVLSKSPYRLALVIVVWPIKEWFSGRFLTQFKGVLAFLACATTIQFIIGITLTFTSRFYASIPEERKFEILLSFLVGGVIGNLFIASSMLAIKQLWQERITINRYNILSNLVILAVLSIAAVYLYNIQPHTLYLLRVLAFIPIIWLASKYGWFGGWSASMVAMSLIAASVYNLPDTRLVIENQFYVVAIGVSGLLFGALVNEQKQLQLSLEKRNDEIALSLDKNRQLASQLVSIQEHERQKFSNELHDEVGQNITALKTELKILELKQGSHVSDDSFSRLHQGADRIYDSVYRVMNWLRPRVLDDLGLKEALSGQYFFSRLKQAGISYHAAIKGDVKMLDDNESVTVFRIVQESVNNCIRHSHAKNFYLLLDVASDKLNVKISDDGKGLNTPKSNNSGGFGLSGIEERVLSLNGQYQLDISHNGFSLVVSFPLNE